MLLTFFRLQTLAKGQCTNWTPVENLEAMLLNFLGIRCFNRNVFEQNYKDAGCTGYCRKLVEKASEEEHVELTLVPQVKDESSYSVSKL